jgi:hypothetical protein
LILEIGVSEIGVREQLILILVTIGLHREALEEFGQEVEVLRQFYTLENFVESRFVPGIPVTGPSTASP